MLSLGQKKTLLCILLALQVQRASRQPSHLLRVSTKDEQEQMTAKVSEGDPGSQLPHTDRTDHHSISSSPATTLPPPTVPWGYLATLPPTPIRATWEFAGGQLAAAVFSSICILLLPYLSHPGKSTENWLCPVATGGQVAGGEEVPRGGHAIPLEQPQAG